MAEHLIPSAYASPEPVSSNDESKKVFIVTDDIFVVDHGEHNGHLSTNSIESLIALSKIYPELCPSILITDQALVGQYKDALLQTGLEIGLHLDLVEGSPVAISNQQEELFGKNGKITQRLGILESEIKQPLPKELEWKTEWELPIYREMFAQTAAFTKMFGRPPAHISYHFGLHNDPEIYKVYLDFVSDLAETQDIPFRYAHNNIGGLKPKSSLHADQFVDDLSIPKVRPLNSEDVFRAVRAIPPGKSAELCMHLGRPEEWYYGQTTLFSDRTLRRGIEKEAQIARASDMPSIRRRGVLHRSVNPRPN